MGEGVLTQPFVRRNGDLCCGDVPAAELAERFGTPLYVYDIRRIDDRVRAFRTAFSGVEHLLAYSVKANGNLSILRRLHAMGCGADITSLGELYRARQAGIPGRMIVFAGVGKTVLEIEAALERRIYAFNVESRGELERIDQVATRIGQRAPFAIRVNPDVFAATPHEYTRTGTAATKFGVPWNETRDLYLWAKGRPNLAAVGIDMHIGSQIVEAEPYVSALELVLDLVTEVSAAGVDLEFLDIGGGYGIRYDDDPGMDLDELAAELVPRVASAGLRLILEPGRSIVGDAGVFLTRVEYVKKSGGKHFVVVDGGMTELIRPSHYGGFHAVEHVQQSRGAATLVDIVDGPSGPTASRWRRTTTAACGRRKRWSTGTRLL